jgi:hypothetical protein
MYCCIAEISSSEWNSSEIEIRRLRETITPYFDSTDQFTIIRRRIVLLTSAKTYAEVKNKFTSIREQFEKRYGSSMRLTCGFAEVKDGDLLSAIDGAKQMLARTTKDKPISGMTYCKLC